MLERLFDVHASPKGGAIRYGDIDTANFEPCQLDKGECGGVEQPNERVRASQQRGGGGGVEVAGGR
jgi:hypothetical protein